MQRYSGFRASLGPVTEHPAEVSSGHTTTEQHDSVASTRSHGIVRRSSPERSPAPNVPSRQQTYPPLSAPQRSSAVGQGNMPARRETAPAAPGYTVTGRPMPGRDLTGRVRKTSQYYFATGGFADLWEGQLKGEAEESWTVRITTALSNFLRFSADGFQFRNKRKRQDANEDLKPLKVAVKILRNITSGYPEANGERLAKRLTREALVWERLSHPNITPFLGFCYDLGQPSVPSLVSPLYENGNISDYLLKRDRDPRVLKLLAQVAAGLVYLHSQTPVVVHGDIKGTNILIDDEGNARLADFGLSRIMESTGLTTKSIAGSCRWMAFELMYTDDPDADDAFTTETDVWAFGMTILEILTGKPPFAEHRHDTGVILGLAVGKRPERPTCNLVTDTMWVIMQSAWHAEPKSRPSVYNIGLVLDLLYFSEKWAREYRSSITEELAKDILKMDRGSSSLHPQAANSFPCKWVLCPQSFRDLEECCKHESTSHWSCPTSLQPFLSQFVAREQPAHSPGWSSYTHASQTRYGGGKRRGNF